MTTVATGISPPTMRADEGREVLDSRGARHHSHGEQDGSALQRVRAPEAGREVVLRPSSRLESPWKGPNPTPIVPLRRRKVPPRRPKRRKRRRRSAGTIAISGWVPGTQCPSRNGKAGCCPGGALRPFDGLPSTSSRLAAQGGVGQLQPPVPKAPSSSRGGLVCCDNL